MIMCKISEHAYNVLTAKSYKGVGRGWIVKNIRPEMSVTDIVSRLNLRPKAEPTCVAEFERIKSGVREKIARHASTMTGITALGDVDFPYVRGEVKDSEQPVVLYYKGRLDLLSKDNRNISVIGLLTPSADIENDERLVVSDLVDEGYTIVSGLALGCDSVAHRMTLEKRGNTVAILPSPIRSIIPAKNVDLADEIYNAGGLLVSEYLDEATSKMELTGRYQERDRLQALFSDGIVLSASYTPNDKGLDSGSRLAMGYAKSYRIPRYVMYDDQRDKDNPMFDLSRLLLQDKDVVSVQQHNTIQRIHSTPVRQVAQQMTLF